MVFTRGCQTREVFFSVGPTIMSWFPAPDESPVSDSIHYGDGATTLLNGFADISGSVYGHKHYELTWSYLNRRQADLFRRLFMNRSGEWVTYLDPFSMNNALSPLMGLPYLHYHVGSPLAFNDLGKQALFPTKALDSMTGHPGVILKPDILAMHNKLGREINGLNGREATLSLSKPGNYTERVAVPKGYYATFYSSGFDDSKRPFEWHFDRIGGDGLPTHIETKEKNRIFGFGDGVWQISMQPLQEGHIAWCSLRIRPENMDELISTGPPLYDYSYPSGGGNLQVVPGTAKVVTVNNARGHFTASVTLEEVWSW